ncbi:MAG TPA: tripartite tricarboxylate transporter substrate-binding protein [Burkholderiales bacterium]|nr:tripartite tricarboxylate transporter substrate-binding protein [Burkholderiales bacterium]
MSVRKALLALAVSAIAVLDVRAADWPAKPVRFIVPYTAGGGTDIVARMIGARLSELYKQPFVIENRPGANGTIGGEAVIKAPADGYTVLFESQSIAVTPAIQKDPPYDVLRAFQPVAQTVTQAFIIVSTASLPVKNLREVVALSKTRPGGLNAAVSGSGTLLSAEFFKLVANTPLTIISYKGGSQAALALVSGESDIGFIDIPSIATQISAGKVNAQAVTTGKRIRLLPDVPTAAEAGLADYKVEGWLGVFVVAGTPPDIVNRISNEIRASVASPEISARIIQLGGEPTPTSAAEFTALVRAEIAHWKDVVARAKIKVE